MKGCLAMQMISKVSCGLVMVLVFAGVLVLTGNARISLAEVSVDSYCQLTIQSMQQEISNFEQLIALANQYRDDPETLAHREKVKKLQFDQAKNTLFSSFGTTAEEYVTYMGRNRRGVKRYLEANPDIKQQIDDLSAQVRSLMDEYESLKGSAAPPPLP